MERDLPTRPVAIAVHGASGRMGGALCALLAEDPRFSLRRAVVSADSLRLQQPVHEAADLCFTAGWSDAPALDVVVDFSSPTGLAETLTYCLKTGTALVTGTTGGDAELHERLQHASEKIALLRAANFSLGIAVLTRVLRDAARALRDWDAEIIEAHHSAKRDAPSGTALALGAAVAQARGDDSAAGAHASMDRQGLRAPGSIGYAVVRGGDIVGEHMAMLIGQGERLELVHRATDRSVFARGALHAAHWLARRGPGDWTLEDALAGPDATTR